MLKTLESYHEMHQLKYVRESLSERDTKACYKGQQQKLPFSAKTDSHNHNQAKNHQKFSNPYPDPKINHSNVEISTEFELWRTDS